MPPPPEKQDPRLMRAMFTTIAPRYEFITRAFSYGMDRGWKRRGVEKAVLPERPLILDLACGTGDFSRLALRRRPGARAVAVDLTERMLHEACGLGVREAVCADVNSLPFADEVFDCVFIGYGLRNFPNLRAALDEVWRVTRPGGQLVTLDFFLPSSAVLRKLYMAYLYLQGTFWGLVLHGCPRVYTYIPDSLRGFLTTSEFSALLKETGHAEVSARRYILGGIGLHWARKVAGRSREAESAS